MKIFNLPIFKLIVLLLLCLITLAYALFQGGFVSWFLFYCFLPYVLYSLILYTYPIQSFRVVRAINQTTFKAGDKLIGTITLTRTVPFPLAYVTIEEVLPSRLQNCKLDQSAKVILFPWFQRTITMQYVIRALPRGEHTFSNIQVSFGDLFGLVEKKKNYPIEETVLVFPKMISLDYRQVYHQFQQGKASSHLKLHRDTTIAVGVREYKPGDKLTWIDWKTTARKNAMMTKEFEQKQSQDVLIMLDRTQAPLFEQMVVFAASLTKVILSNEVKAGFISVGKDKNRFPITNGTAHFQTIYHHLARVQPDAISTFSKIIEKESKAFPNSVTVMFITNQMSSDLVHTFEKLTMQNMTVMLFLITNNTQQLSMSDQNMIESVRHLNIYVKLVEKALFPPGI